MTGPIVTGGQRHALRRRLALALVGTAVIAGSTECASASSAGVQPAATIGASSGPGAPSAATTSAPSRGVTSTLTSAAGPAEQVCAAAFPTARLLAWATGTVGQFRDYHYSGPRAMYPLASAFPGVDVGTSGAWCGTELDTDAIRWSAVVAGQPTARALDLHGPGASRVHGDVGQPPHPP